MNEIRDLLHRFIGFIKASAIYPPGHNRRLISYDAFMEQGQKLFARDQKIVIHNDAKTLSVNSQTFDPDDSTITAFLPELIRRNIRSITIEARAIPLEINALAQVLTLDPSEFSTKGVAQDRLAERGVKRIRIHAFSTSHGASHLPSHDASNLPSDSAYASASTSEEAPASVGELTSNLEPSKPKTTTTEDEPQLWMTELSRHPTIRHELDWFDRTLKSGSMSTTIDKHDLLLAMTASYLQAYPEKSAPDDDAKEAISGALKSLHTSIAIEAGSEEGSSTIEILDHIALDMMKEPDSIFKWLAERNEHIELGPTAPMGELLKATFTRSETGSRTIRFGDTELKTLNTATAIEEHTAEAPSAAEALSMSDVFKLFVRLKRSMGTNPLRLSHRDVSEVHFYILNDLLLREEDSRSRIRIAQELKQFLTAHLTESDQEESPFKFEYIEERIFKLRHDEQARVMQSPDLFLRVLSAFLNGEQRWYGTLTYMARSTPDEFANQLGEWCLSDHGSMMISEIKDLIVAGEKALIPWLDKKSREPMHGMHVNRLAEIAFYCKRHSVLAVIERLLQYVDNALFGKLVRKLIASKEPASIKAIARELQTAEGGRKELILHSLGDSPLPQAEDLLIETISNTSHMKNESQVLCAALWSLGRCGTERAIPELKKLKSNLLLLFTKSNRMIKDHADKAYRAVKDRGKKPGMR